MRKSKRNRAIRFRTYIMDKNTIIDPLDGVRFICNREKDIHFNHYALDGKIDYNTEAQYISKISFKRQIKKAGF